MVFDCLFRICLFTVPEARRMLVAEASTNMTPREIGYLLGERHA
jgi:hypothetical protein